MGTSRRDHFADSGDKFERFIKVKVPGKPRKPKPKELSEEFAQPRHPSGGSKGGQWKGKSGKWHTKKSARRPTPEHLRPAPSIRPLGTTPTVPAPAPKYTDEMTEGVGNYAETIGVNPYLREGLEGDPSSPEFNSTIKQMDAAIDISSPLKSDAEFYRGIPTEFAPEFKVGTVIKDKGFTSTTKSRRYAKDFIEDSFGEGAGTRLRILVPKGTKALDINTVSGREFSRMDWQKEVVLKRGSSFRVQWISPDSKEVTLSLLKE